MWGANVVASLWNTYVLGKGLMSSRRPPGQLCYVWALKNPNGTYGPTDCRLIEPSGDLDARHESHALPDDFPPYHSRQVSIDYHTMVVVVNDFGPQGSLDSEVTVQFIGGPHCGRWGLIARGKLQ